MATAKSCLALWRNSSLPDLASHSQPLPLRIFLPSLQVRHASGSSQKSGKFKKKDAPKKRKPRNTFKQYDLKNADQFALCDAMRYSTLLGIECQTPWILNTEQGLLSYIRAFEVGRPPTSSKYEMHLKLRTLKNGPTIRNRIQLPHPVHTSIRICVICPPDSPIANAAIRTGASVVGEETVFDAVKDGRIEFDRCICHVDSIQKLNKAGLGRILGPKGLLPSVKLGTVVKDVAGSVREMIGGSEYRERMGVVRMAVGQLGFTPEEMQRNIRAFVEKVKKDMAQLSDKINKELHEVVLSSTNAPGFSLNGDFRSPTSPPPRDLSTL